MYEGITQTIHGRGDGGGTGLAEEERGVRRVSGDQLRNLLKNRGSSGRGRGCGQGLGEGLGVFRLLGVTGEGWGVDGGRCWGRGGNRAEKLDEWMG